MNTSSESYSTTGQMKQETDENTQSDKSNFDQSDEADRTLAQQIADNERQMYERSQQHLQEIEEEVRKNQPLVSEKQDIAHLIAEFDERTSPQYFKKATDLGGVYSHIRRIRGDGNCFYRAVLTAQLERCFDDEVELNRFSQLVRGWRKRLMDLGKFPELTTGDFCDSMDQLMDSMLNGTTLPQMLMDNLNEDSVANYFVAFMRLITSGFLRENEALYSGFIEGGRSLDQFCRDEIEPMWHDCDHLSCIALVNAIGVPIRIEYMDRTQAPSGGWQHDFLVEGEQQPKLYFLYRPGHYDILYRRADDNSGGQT